MSVNKLFKDINNGVRLKENAPLLVKELGALDAKSGLINLAFSYSILYENIDGTNVDKDIDTFVDKINEIIKEVFEGTCDKAKQEAAISSAESLRKDIIERVDTLTAYTDVFQIYEYVLNRIKGRYEDVDTAPDIDALVERSFGYMFSDTDNAAVNERIKDILSQLPVRMTKQKFYETVSEAMSIYKGSDMSSLNLFDYMLRTCGMIYKTNEFDGIYKELADTAAAFKETDYDTLTKDEFDARFAKLNEVGEFISDAFDRLSLIVEVLNNLLIYLFTMQYAISDSETDTALASVKETLAAFNGKYTKVSDYVEVSEGFFAKLEGFLENSRDDMAKLDASREILVNENYEVLTELDIEEEVNDLAICALLASESRFVDYKKFFEKTGTVGEEEFKNVRDALIADYDALFTGLSKRIRRAVMAEAIKNMPVFLNSKTEIEQYIRYALESCTDKAELAGCVASIKLITESDF